MAEFCHDGRIYGLYGSYSSSIETILWVNLRRKRTTYALFVIITWIIIVILTIGEAFAPSLSRRTKRKRLPRPTYPPVQQAQPKARPMPAMQTCTLYMSAGAALHAAVPALPSCHLAIDVQLSLASCPHLPSLHMYSHAMMVLHPVVLNRKTHHASSSSKERARANRGGDS